MKEIIKMIPGGFNNPEVVVIVGIVIILFLIILGILWFILPFAIFGTKAKLEEIITENKDTNALIKTIIDENKITNARIDGIILKIKSLPDKNIGSDISEELIDEDGDKRKYPRLEFICTATVMGQMAKITDLSIGGLFIEIEKPSDIKIGKTMNIDLTLPTEYDPIRVKVKCTNQKEKGFGCQFVDLSPENQRAISNCFGEFRNTIPISD
jgi:hypothetical protein